MDPILASAAKAAIDARILDVLPPLSFYVKASPIILMMFGAVCVVLEGVFRSDPDKPRMSAMGVSLASTVAALAMPLYILFHNAFTPAQGSASPILPKAYLGSGFLSDDLANLGFVAVGLGTLVTLLAAHFTNAGRQLMRPEFAALLLFASAGMMTMVSAGEFIAFFMGLEVTSISLYVLVGYQRETPQALEAAVKYFILGASAVALILFGTALLYLHTGSLKWADLARVPMDAAHPLALAGGILFFSGMAFKLAIAPFHAWAPDVYQGSQSLLTGYMATLVKLSLVFVLIRFLGAAGRPGSAEMVLFFEIIGAASIIVGSLFGLVQASVKRMLAYSSVANAGYFCLAFAALSANPASLAARQTLTAFTTIYAVTSLGAFAVLAWLEQDNREDLRREELSGLAKREPFAAVVFTMFLFGLGGIPPLAGFFSKLLLLGSAVDVGLVGLPIILVLMSCVSLYYYLSLMVEMWFKDESGYSLVPTRIEATAKGMKWITGALAAITLVVGVVGPRWAMSLNYAVAVEPNVRPGTTLAPMRGEASPKKDEAEKRELRAAQRVP